MKARTLLLSFKMTPPAITQLHPPMQLDELVAKIAGFTKQTGSEQRAFIDQLVKIHPTLNVRWGPGWRYRRARQLDVGEIPQTVDDVIWPKGAPAKVGRANPKGFRVMYLADRRDTALREARVHQGWVAIAEFQIRPQQAVFICPIGELSQIVRTGRGYMSGDSSKTLSDMLNACPLQQSRALIITDAFLYEQMTGHEDYDMSSRVASAIFDKLPNVSGIAYSSRRQLGAINFAVRADTFWQSWALTSVRRAFAEHLALGFYRLKQVTGVTGVYQSG
ncbi:MAG: RES family NAD+ phosphorylase, partial [Pyrinomonadaceae bacterium]|nr:RES family NAD+ phosphorylase [Pyrinomonadaceae bacterium]